MSEFILKNVEITLDPASIEKAIETVEKLKTDLGSALKRVCEQLAKSGAEMARANIILLGAVGESGNLLGSVKYFPEGEVWYISAGDKSTEIDQDGNGPRSGYTVTNYAVFVEYGTGAVTEKQMHPTYINPVNPTATAFSRKLHYDRHKNMVKRGKGLVSGWVYKKGNRFYTAHAMPARPFMYTTMNELRQEAERVGGYLVAQYIP